MYGIRVGRFAVELVFCSNDRAVTNGGVTGVDGTVDGVVVGGDGLSRSSL